MFWGVATVWAGTQLLGQPAGYLIFALALVFVFALVNGISAGTDRLESDFFGLRGHGAS